MMSIKHLSLTFLLYLAASVTAFAEAPAPAIDDCTYEPFQISFHCNPNWAVQEDEGLAIFEISASPKVYMSITQISDKVKFLGQINKADLELTGQYAPGFTLEDAVINDLKAKKVNGFSFEDINIRYLDYYVLNQGMLYSIQFTVHPKDRWDDYKFLFQDVAGSFKFKEEGQVTVR